MQLSDGQVIADLLSKLLKQLQIMPVLLLIIVTAIIFNIIYGALIPYQELHKAVYKIISCLIFTRIS